MVSELEREIKKHFSIAEVSLIIKAYEYASVAHSGQKRKSGEPYIIHPIHVAYLLMTKFHLYDANAVCAALLHDTLEDTTTTYEDLLQHFNEDIAKLVLSVTDSNNVSFNNKTEEERFNNAAILRNMLKDYRTIYIKSADRFHNMSTLEYQDEQRRLNKAHQTLAFYVPLNYGIGANEAAKELDDLCLRFIFPDEYYRTLALKQECEVKHQKDFENMLIALTNNFLTSGIKATINMHMKNISGIYNDLGKMAIEDIPDLINIHIIVGDREECYKVYAALAKNYKVAKVKNSLMHPKFNGYRAIELDLEDFFGHTVKVSICTAKMEEANLYGHATISNHIKAKQSEKIQKIVARGSEFYIALKELGEFHKNNSRLLRQVESELFNSRINIHTKNGVISLPEKTTIADYLKKSNIKNGHVYVNGVLVASNFVLSYGDKVFITKTGVNPIYIRSRKKQDDDN